MILVVFKDPALATPATFQKEEGQLLRSCMPLWPLGNPLLCNALYVCGCRGQKLMFSILLSFLSTFCFETKISHWVWLPWLASKSQGSTSLCLPRANYRELHHTFHFCGGAGDPNSMLIVWHLTSWILSPAPSRFFSWVFRHCVLFLSPLESPSLPLLGSCCILCLI